MMKWTKTTVGDLVDEMKDSELWEQVGHYEWKLKNPPRTFWDGMTPSQRTATEILMESE